MLSSPCLIKKLSGLPRGWGLGVADRGEAGGGSRCGNVCCGCCPKLDSEKIWSSRFSICDSGKGLKKGVPRAWRLLLNFMGCYSICSVRVVACLTVISYAPIPTHWMILFDSEGWVFMSVKGSDEGQQDIPIILSSPSYIRPLMITWQTLLGNQDL